MPRERRQHAVLAAHVVRGRDDVTERRAAQHPRVRSPSVTAYVRFERPPAISSARERAVAGARDVLGEPRRAAASRSTPSGASAIVPPIELVSLERADAER